MEPNCLTLKNGQEEFKPLIVVTMLSLRALLAEQPIAFYELVMKCRDRNHQFFGNAGEKLKSLQLVQPGGSIHGSIRNIVLSATSGDDLELVLHSPIKEE